MNEDNKKRYSGRGFSPENLDGTTKNTEFKTGAVRGESTPMDYHSVSPVGMRRLAETHHQGNKRYGDYNWERGIPINNLINHALAHIFKFLSGNKDEDHLAHAAWGLMASMDMEENRPDMNHGLRKQDVRESKYDQKVIVKIPRPQGSVINFRATHPTILLKKTDAVARIPAKAHTDDAGYDLFIISPFVVPPHSSLDVSVGFNIKIQDGYWGLIKGRSSTLMKRRLNVMEGVIDSNYTGPLSIVITNNTDKPIGVTVGERLAQLIIIENVNPHFKMVEDMPKTDRGNKGFGSTGA